MAEEGERRPGGSEDGDDEEDSKEKHVSGIDTLGSGGKTRSLTISSLE